MTPDPFAPPAEVAVSGVPAVPAAWEERARARLADGLVGVICLGLPAIYGAATGEWRPALLGPWGLLVGIQTAQLVAHGATLGQRAVGLWVVDATGRPARIPRLLVREAVGIPLLLLWVPLALAARRAGFDPTWGTPGLLPHDRALGTRVVRARRPTDPSAGG